MALDLSPGKAALGTARLIDAIIKEMAGGVIPFDRFMDLALYHPRWGYYRTPGRIGKSGDFLTSPVIHPMFGWAIAGWCNWVWRELGSPPEFTIFEPGAGLGQLATSILDWAAGREGSFAKALRYIAIEPNSPGDDDRIAWATPPLSPARHGVVVSNEFFDALPVKLFEASERGPVEIGVRWDGAQFEETRLGVSDIDGAPSEGRFEVSPRAYPTMRSLCGLVEQGAILTIDYGYPREELWAPWRLQGTLLSFYKHTSQESPYIRVGEQDLTAHVNFTELEAAADAEGFETYGPTSQAYFLSSLGLHAVVEDVRGQMEEYLIRRRALEQLTDGAGLGRIRVLAATRGISGIPPGFETR
jgi:SAM-dependent MidA family methyltransferase